MNPEVRILLLEDSLADAELVEREVRRAGIECRCLRVDTLETFTSALQDFDPDLILSDNALPAFDALSALTLTRKRNPDAGFVVVSGTVGEERAVEMLKSGVTDYVLKDHLNRLGPVVRRALAEAEQRRGAREAEESAREANERFRSAFEHAPAGMAVIGLDGRLRQVNGALRELLGRTEPGLLSSTLVALTHPLDQAASRGILERLLADGPRSQPVEQRFLHADGHPVWALLGVSLLTGADGLPVHFVGQFVDITATKDAEARLAHQALYDQLTGLPNRTLINDRLTQALSQCGKKARGVTLLFVDLDHFKGVNDSLGHGAGDVVLVAVAERLRGLAREGDTAGRFGGDEFVLVCDDPVDEQDPAALADRVAQALKAPFWVAGKQLTMTASVGIATATSPYVRAQDLLRNADAAMYRAKELGKNRAIIFDEAMRVRAMTRFNIESDLRLAIDRSDLAVYYQPQVNLQSGRLVGFEALVRWHHPERGLVGPDEFISVAEDTGLIVRLGTWVLEQACREAASWPAARRDLLMSVNVSARQLADPDFLGAVARVLAETGLNPAALCLEVTESVLVVASETISLAIVSLRELGVQVSIDDFGTGYASLSYLVQFHPDSLKIDKTFVQRVGEDSMNFAIVAAIVGLAHSLGLTVVAEGIETTQQLSLLRDLACDQAQGFLFAEALPAELARGLLVEVAPPWDVITIP